MSISSSNYIFLKAIGIFIFTLVCLNQKAFTQPVTITLYPSGTPSNLYATGYVTNAGSKNDCNLVNVNATNIRGWATFALPYIPPGSVIESAEINFTTYSTTNSSVNNNLYCFTGSTLALSGTTLYTQCGSGTLINTSTWLANALQSKSFNTNGLNFLSTNLGAGTLINIGFVRGSTVNYSIYGYCSAEPPSLTITYTPPCFLPNNFSLGNTLSSANPVCPSSSFTLSVENTTSLLGTGYSAQWQWSADINAWQDIPGAINPSYTDTWQYNAASRYYRMKISCFNTMHYSTPIEVVKETNFMQCYCTPVTLTNGCTQNREYISQVRFQNINHSTSCSGNNQYSNYTSEQTTVLQGSSVMTQVEVSNSFLNDNVRVWIDFNHNSSYADGGEEFTLVRSANSGTQWFNGIITIPLNALSGETSMRVRLAAATPTPCGTLIYGETEDYRIVIQEASIPVQIKAYVAGYYTGSGLMDKVLYNQGVETNTSTNNTDIIDVTLHEDSPNFPVLAKASGILKRDGQIQTYFPNTVLGKMSYIVLKHRGCVSTWSALPMLVANSNSYDFSTSAGKAFGSNQTAMSSGIWAMYSGDINHDDVIDAFDFLVMEPYIVNGDSGYLQADTNGDGTVDAFDFIEIEQNLIEGIGILAP